MPLLEDLKDQLKSDSADLKHTGDRWGGSISAALFLREFIGTVPNWVHCDIAGPAMGDRVRGWDPKGGTGHGVLTFLSLIDHTHRSAAVSPPKAPPPTPAAPPATPSAPSVAKAAPRDAAAKAAKAAKAPKAAPEKGGARAPRKTR
jgi:leucyl aminopeptidase